MIISDKDHCLDYLGINKYLDEALYFIHETDFLKIENGDYLINGEDVRVKVLSTITKHNDKVNLEAHNRFADI
ncbi:MAG: YhcH/YjgK/YiaL family protein, partial [Bacteroidales bacterium]|nr:YhcH/YjgK/YiaL family protein [Bacteroidales bacterium]